MSFTIRPADWDIHGERNMVRKSWLRSNFRSASARAVGDKAYYSGHHDLIDTLLDRCEVRVACSETSRETIIGWACMTLDTVHFVFVVEDFRRHGVAKALLHDKGERVVYTHRTDMLKGFTLPERWFFDPYKLCLR